MGDGGADAGQEEQPGSENAGGGAVCCNLTQNLSHPLRVGSDIFRMQVSEGCGAVLLESSRQFVASVFGIPIALRIHGYLTGVSCSNLFLHERDFSCPYVCNTLEIYPSTYSNSSKQ